MKVVILAGGFGTRISEESHLKPKPMIEIGEKPILWHIMKYYSQFGYNEFIICLGYKQYVVKEFFADYFLHTSDVTFDLANNSMKVHNNYSEPWKVTLIGAIAVVFSGVLTEREAIDNMNMSTVLLYVGVTVLGEGLSQTGAAEMLGNWIANVLSGVSNGYVIGAAFYIVAYIMTSLLYNRAVTTVLVPLTVITCGSMGCDPRGPIILCALASMSSLITPLSTAVVPMAMNAGGYSAKTVFKAGLIPGILRGALGVLIAMTLFPAFG